MTGTPTLGAPAPWTPSHEDTEQVTDSGLITRRGAIRTASGVIVGAAGLAGVAGIVGTPTGSADAATTTLDALRQYQNVYRRRHGVAPLRNNSVLNKAAQRHALDMARRRTMSHTGGDGSNAGTRIGRAGYPWSAWAENIAAGYTKAADVANGWYNSPSHRASMLNPTYHHEGSSWARATNGVLYWCVVFARP